MVNKKLSFHKITKNIYQGTVDSLSSIYLKQYWKTVFETKLSHFASPTSGRACREGKMLFPFTLQFNIVNQVKALL